MTKGKAGWSSPKTDQEDATESELLMIGYMQTPDHGNRKEEDPKIGDQV